MDGIAESDVAIEVSTAGLRKPVGEIYPARPFLEMCLDAGRPVALSSDAHVPEHLGFEYERARRVAGGRRRDRARRLRGPRAAAGADRMSARSGIGYDSHRLDEGRPLVLGGVEVAGAERGLDGPLRRRRADPRRDRRAARRRGARRHRPALPRHRRALARRRQRSQLLREVVRDAGASAAGRSANVDATVICEAPKLGALPRADARAPRRGARGRPDAVNVKFTTNEGMGSSGAARASPRSPRRRSRWR